MKTSAKLRPVYLLDILKRYTDDEHPLTTAQICAILERDYALPTHRTTVKSDIELLQESGIDIQLVKSRQNLYNYIDRDFDIAELKLLIDAVLSSKFIPKKRSEVLVQKLSNLAGPYQGSELERNLCVTDRIKLHNEKILYIVDRINTAINLKKRISFQMLEYTPDKQRILHNEGEVYTFSPYTLVWDGDYYYMMGYSDKYEKLLSHRVDRITEIPQLLEDGFVEAPEDFDFSEHLNSMFRMFDTKRQRIELLCENKILPAVFDRFGLEADTHPVDETHFRFRADISTSPVFYDWLFGFGNQIQIISPKSLKREYRKLLEERLAALEENNET